MKVLILAAGRSRRLKPIEDKNCIRFCGKTLLEHHLDALKEAGFTEQHIVAGPHNREPVEAIAKAYNAVVHLQEDLEAGMAGAILSAESALKNQAFLIVNGGDYVEPKAYQLIKNQLQPQTQHALLAYQVSSYFPGGYLKLDETDPSRISSIVEKPEPGTEPSNLVNLVVHWHQDGNALYQALHAVQSDRDDRYEVALDTLMKKNYVQAIPYDGVFFPLKKPVDVLDLNEYFLGTLKAEIHPTAQVAETAILKGPVVLAEGVKILDHAVISGPAYIGKNTVVANHTLVRHSSIGEDCMIGANTEVARSLIGDKTWFHSNYVGDSVIGNECSFGAGGICANLRLDEGPIGETERSKLGAILGDEIRVGVNTSLMPGVTIGSNSLISSGLVIAQNIAEKSYVKGKMELEIRENRTA